MGATAKRTTSAPSAINADAAADRCAHCTSAPRLLVCLGCHQAGYCSLACQQGAWCVWDLLCHRELFAHIDIMCDIYFIASARRAGHKKACKAARKERAPQGDQDVMLIAPSAAASLRGAALDSQDSPAAPHSHVCDQWGTTAPDLLVCLGCHKACYCCKACQKAAWWVTTGVCGRLFAG